MCLQDVRIRISNPILPDPLIEIFGDKKKIEDILYLTFKGEEMYDCDIKPSFSSGPKSYYSRLKEGNMINYVVERLAKIPESKKAVISFIQWEDYAKVLKNPFDDYLPCIVSIQFRLLWVEDHYSMTVVFNSRSIDAFQKSNGNLIAIIMLTKKIISNLINKLEQSVTFDILDGMITDAHIYQECYNDAEELIKKYENRQSNFL